MKKEVRAPFIPKVTDPDRMRKSSEKIVKLNQLEETIIPMKSREMISAVDKEVFNNFGMNIDKSLQDRILVMKRESREFKSRQI